MGIFTTKPTPNDCAKRIIDARYEINNIQVMLDATPKGKAYEADWEANRKRAKLHLDEAWKSLENAHSTLSRAQFRKTNDDSLELKIDEIHALRKEMAAVNEVARQWKAESDGWQSAGDTWEGVVQQLTSDRDTSAASCEMWKQRALVAEAALSSGSPHETDRLRRIRVLLMSSIHPDRVPPDDRPAMTRAWQSFMPSFESLLRS